MSMCLCLILWLICFMHLVYWYFESRLKSLCIEFCDWSLSRELCYFGYGSDLDQLLQLLSMR